MPSKFLYSAEVQHKGLNKYRVVKAETQYELNQKTDAIIAQWNEQWAKKVDRENRIKNIEDALAYAEEMTRQAEAKQKALSTILVRTINPKPINIKKAKDFSEFTVPKPNKPILTSMPPRPKRSQSIYNEKPSFLARFSKKKKMEIENKNENAFRKDLADWEAKQRANNEINDSRINKYEEMLDKWNKDKEEYYYKQSQANQKIDTLYEKYKIGDAAAVEWYFELLINSIDSPIDYERRIDVEYSTENKMLIVDMLLPMVDDIPRLKKVDYIKTRNEYKNIEHSEAYLKKTYDDVIYQLVLQTVNYVFSASANYNIVDSIVINGKVHTIDKATGKEIEPYILSVDVSREEFAELNLDAIDSKAWFRSQKGISAVTFVKVTPIAPIVEMKKEDSRFIEGYSVVESIDNRMNLAAIDWQDFENLVREIFEHEFSTNGGEVKITQTSRDGGVDAVAFDPDPIRGGKIVIQAKRYTNIVGVSAVRDLYGTVVNEGATKGILVTTSNYGKDAYKFAQGKPLVLMNGANLLHLLEKHGYKARININEAKEIINSQK